MSVCDLTPLGRGAGAGRPADASQQRSLTARAQVARAPGSESDSMHVVLKNLSLRDGYEIPAGNWQPRGTTLPVVGNACCVTFDDEGDAWVGTHWSPF